MRKEYLEIELKLPEKRWWNKEGSEWMRIASVL